MDQCAGLEPLEGGTGSSNRGSGALAAGDEPPGVAEGGPEHFSTFSKTNRGIDKVRDGRINRY